MFFAITLVLIGGALTVLGIGFRTGGEKAGQDWRRRIPRDSSRDHLIFFGIPGIGGAMLFMGLMVLLQSANQTLLAALCLVCGTVSFAVWLFWHFLSLPYPLFLVPAWYRPIKQEQRQRRRERRKERKEQRKHG